MTLHQFIVSTSTGMAPSWEHLRVGIQFVLLLHLSCASASRPMTIQYRRRVLSVPSTTISDSVILCLNRGDGLASVAVSPPCVALAQGVDICQERAT